MSRISVAVALLAFALLAGARGQALSTGPPPGATGTPAGGTFQAEMSCGGGGCHDSAEPNADSLGRIELTGVPERYSPGARYRLTLKVSHPQASRWGFQATSVFRETFDGAGTFAPLGAATQTVAGGIGRRAYIMHGVAGRAATGVGQRDSFSWEFEWVAPLPTTEAGEVQFFASANAANGDGGPGGDHIYFAQSPLATTRR
ncbi:MAG: choice-of-anchor V domain-containing protein [Vicinamibacterales bacterium]